MHVAGHLRHPGVADRGDRRDRGISTLIGVIVGLLAGYYRGWVDTLLSRIIDLLLSIPLLLLGIGIGAACAVNGCLGGAIQPGPRRRSSS